MIKPFFKSTDKKFNLLHGDCIDLLSKFNFKFDMIFADPPYFLSNGGSTFQNGKITCVDKGKWDKSKGFDNDNKFNYNWIKACRKHLSENGTIWISGTYHNIFSVTQMLVALDFKILNCVTWVKKNPPLNFSGKYFTHSTEFIIWARKNKKITHHFNSELIKKINGGKPMKDVWELSAVSSWEKSCGKHPTQKPLSLLTRIILSSTNENAWILDPFTGSSTTGIAANLLNRQFLGIDIEEDFLIISKNRKLEIEDSYTIKKYKEILMV